MNPKRVTPAPIPTARAATETKRGAGRLHEQADSMAQVEGDPTSRKRHSEILPGAGAGRDV